MTFEEWLEKECGITAQELEFKTPQEINKLWTEYCVEYPQKKWER